jgi:hypothetical protein
MNLTFEFVWSKCSFHVNEDSIMIPKNVMELVELTL